RGTLVIVDGFIATAAAAVVLSIEPSAKRAMVFAHQSAEHGHRAALDALSVRPLLDLGLRLGEGTGALLAWPLVQAAAAMMSDMASFDSAGISGPS
ncbi:MAG: nicotinate-nucleotide--dimethylbenzimidazole phosphoribosyltransferase, partial [Pseudomonadota bacterium]